MRIRLDGVPHRFDEDHISAKGINSLSRNNLAHKFIPMPRAIKIPDVIGSSGERMEHLEEIPAWQLTSQKQERGDR